MDLIQVKFSWEIQARGQKRKLAGLHGDTEYLGGIRKKRGSVTEKGEDTQEGRPSKTRDTHPTCEIFSHNLLLGGGILKPGEASICRPCSWRGKQVESGKACTGNPSN